MLQLSAYLSALEVNFLPHIMRVIYHYLLSLIFHFLIGIVSLFGQRFISQQLANSQLTYFATLYFQYHRQIIEVQTSIYIEHTGFLRASFQVVHITTQ